MTKQIKQGDFVRVPQLVVLYRYAENGDIHSMLKIEHPLAAIYLGEKEVNNVEMKELLLDGEMWYAYGEDIQQWRDYANKHD